VLGGGYPTGTPIIIKNGQVSTSEIVKSNLPQKCYESILKPENDIWTTCMKVPVLSKGRKLINAAKHIPTIGDICSINNLCYQNLVNFKEETAKVCGNAPLFEDDVTTANDLADAIRSLYQVSCLTKKNGDSCYISQLSVLQDKKVPIDPLIYVNLMTLHTFVPLNEYCSSCLKSEMEALNYIKESEGVSKMLKDEIVLLERFVDSKCKSIFDEIEEDVVKVAPPVSGAWNTFSNLLTSLFGAIAFFSV
ncbi:hypothetical protein HDV02_005446, partial [Globomyces sp. JEL0801]